MRNHSYYDVYHRQKRVPDIGKIRNLYGKKGVFLLSFLLSATLIRLFWWKEMEEVAGWSRLCFERMDTALDQTEALVSYVVIRRTELLLFLLLCGMTRIRKILYYVICGVSGMMFGVFFLSFVKDYGIRGVILCGGTLLPQWILYGMLFAFLYWIFVRRRELEIEGTKGRFVLYLLGILMMLLAGIYLECFVNPIIVGFLKKLFLTA